MSRKKVPKPATVPFAAKQAGEVQCLFPFGEPIARWGWTEPSVWTERMLTALDHGVKGGKWFSLIDKVSSPANLRSAFREVAANGGAAGVDHVTVAMFADRLDDNLEVLSDSLRSGSYVPQAVRRTWIPKPGSSEQRPLGVPNVLDHLIQQVIAGVLTPIFDPTFSESSFGFRPC
jgi:RNA-directed DNA polymerase